jgi:tail lysozyme
MSHAVDVLMKEANLTQTGAAGLVARWAKVESSGGPTSVNPRSGAVGIGQWLGGRKDASASGTFDEQLLKAAHELNTSEKRAGDILRQAKTPLDAATGASTFERAEGYNPRSGRDNFTLGTPVEAVLAAIRKTAAPALAGASDPPVAPGRLRGKSDPINPSFGPNWHKVSTEGPFAPYPQHPHTQTPELDRFGRPDTFGRSNSPSIHWPTFDPNHTEDKQSWLGADENAKRLMASNWGGDTVHHHYDNSDNSTTHNHNQKYNVNITGVENAHEVADS